MGEFFKTAETPLVAYLMTCGFTIQDILWKGDRAYFLFPDGDALDSAVKDYKLQRPVEIIPSQLLRHYQDVIKLTRRDSSHG